MTDNQVLQCAYCHSPLDRITAPLCSECHAAHHDACWAENGGCAAAPQASPAPTEDVDGSPGFSGGAPQYFSAEAENSAQFAGRPPGQVDYSAARNGAGAPTYPAPVPVPAPVAAGPASGSLAAHPMGPVGWYDVPGLGRVYGIPWVFVLPAPGPLGPSW